LFCRTHSAVLQSGTLIGYQSATWLRSENLRLLITATYPNGETEEIQTTRNPANGRWEGNIEIATGTSVSISVLWAEMFQNVMLELAKANRRVDVPFDIEELRPIRFQSNEYDTTADDDRDRLSNLSERNTRTDPLDATSPGGTLVEVRVGVRLETPVQLSQGNTDPNSQDILPTTATVNGTAVAMRYEDGAWIGETTALRNSDVFLEAVFGSESVRNVTFAQVSRNMNVGQNGDTIIIRNNEYQVEFDDDNDGLDNHEEYVGNTDPRDPDSPMRDPCELSQFNQGCEIDTDDTIKKAHKLMKIKMVSALKTTPMKTTPVIPAKPPAPAFNCDVTRMGTVKPI